MQKRTCRQLAAREMWPGDTCVSAALCIELDARMTRTPAVRCVVVENTGG